MSDLVRQMLYLPEQASTVAQEIDQLHYVVIGVTMLGATGVFLTAIFFTVRYRRRDDDALTPVTQATVLGEGMIFLSLLGLFLAFWFIGFGQYMRLRLPPDDALEVYVTARQWMWKFAHGDGRREAGTLVVPAGVPIKLVMTSRDVIHSFYVPAFRIKQDVLPGRYVTAWFEAREPGTYRLYCAEFCGVAHSEMVGAIRVLSPSDWERWIEGLREEPLAQVGAEVAARKGCLSCHTLDGQRHVGPSFRGLYGSWQQLEDGRVYVDEAYLTRSMMQPREQIVAGYAPVMPTYQGQLDPMEVGALLELIRSLRDPLPGMQGVDYPELPGLDVRELTPPLRAPEEEPP